jgi:uncharacterized protein (TIGR02246 family)
MIRHLYRGLVGVLRIMFALMVPLAACGREDVVNRGPTVADQAGSEARAAPTSEVAREVQARTEAFLSAWEGRDPAPVAAFFTEDATAVIDGNRLTGRAAIERGWLAQNVPVISGLRITTTDGEDQRREQIVVRGRYAFTARPPQEAEQRGAGRHELVWTRVGGSWQIASMTIHNE